MVAFDPVDGDVPAAADLTEEDTIVQLMHWIGFTNEGIRTRIINDSIGSLMVPSSAGWCGTRSEVQDGAILGRIG